MKLLRYGNHGAEKPGILDAQGRIRDLSQVVPDISAETLGDMSFLANLDLDALPLVDGYPRLGACVAGVGKFMCIGLNYADHAAESGQPVPTEPILFMKANSAICGANEDIVIPRGAQKVDWEVELGVVIGRAAKHVTMENALDHVAGYCVVNDVSERSLQLEGSGQWTKGKSCDTFGPIGPWLVTPDEVSDPQALSLWLEVNNQLVQSGSTATMVFDVAELISYLSNLFTLHPGDLIATGTPPGVGMGMKPPRYLMAGDQVKLGIGGLGVQSQSVAAEI